MAEFPSKWICARARQVQQLGVSGALIATNPCTPGKPCNANLWSCGWRFILEVPADGPDRTLKIDDENYSLATGAELIPTYIRKNPDGVLSDQDQLAVHFPIGAWIALRELLLRSNNLFFAYSDEITTLEVELQRNGWTE